MAYDPPMGDHFDRDGFTSDITTINGTLVGGTWSATGKHLHTVAEPQAPPSPQGLAKLAADAAGKRHLRAVE